MRLVNKPLHPQLEFDWRLGFCADGMGIPPLAAQLHCVGKCWETPATICRYSPFLTAATVRIL
jgi:hypothetical protein